MQTKSIQQTIFEAVVMIALVLLAITDVNAQQAEETITIDQPTSEDLYLAGQSIHILSEVDGDLVSAGRRISVEKNISGDVISAGERLIIRGQIGDDVRLAGRTISLYSEIKDDAVVAGETVTLAPDAVVGGRMWAAGRTVEVAGTVSKELRAAGNNITISGTVQGDVSLVAEDIEILPGARIAGNLTYRSENEASIASGAEISGKIERKKIDIPERPEVPALPVIAAFFLSILLCVCVIYWVFPTLTKDTSRILRSDAFKCLGIGLVVFLVMPVLAILLLVIVLGIPLGLILLALYPVVLFVGFAIGVYVVSNLVLGLMKRGSEITSGWRALGIALVLLILVLVQLIPFVGGLALLFVVLGGLGALSLHILNNRAQEL